MIDVMMKVAQNPVTPWLVLCGAGMIVVIEAVRVSRTALWGDMFTEDMDD